MVKIAGFSLLFVILTGCSSSPGPSSLPALPTEEQASLPSDPTSGDLPSTDQVEAVLSEAQISYYEITGSTADQLRAQMTALGPTDPYDNDLHVDAYSDWFISWNWPGYGSTNCDLSSPSVSYELTLVLPNWILPSNADPVLVTKWNDYLSALKVHEAGHLENIINNYQSVITAIKTATCSTADAAASTALEALRQFDSTYDAETQHGATQGAIFP